MLWAYASAVIGGYQWDGGEEWGYCLSSGRGYHHPQSAEDEKGRPDANERSPTRVSGQGYREASAAASPTASQQRQSRRGCCTGKTYWEAKGRMEPNYLYPNKVTRTEQWRDKNTATVGIT